MAINSRFKYFLPVALLLLGLSAVQAQTAGYYLDPNSEIPRFIQKLAWSGGTNSLHCEVIIEKEENGNFVSYHTGITTENYLEISLPPGDYRFRVIPYDILGKPSTGTQWAQFKVFNAVKPELYQPEDDMNYYNDKKGSKFYFNGNNIEPDAQVYFINSEGKHIAPVEIIRSYDGSSVNLVFDKGQLTDGEYDVVVVNPGGLETSIGGVDYKTYREKFGLFHSFFGASFLPTYRAYGEEASYGNFPYYLSLRFGLISCMFLDNYFGVEFTLSRMSRLWDEYYYVEDTSSIYTFNYNLLFINWLDGRNKAINLRFGIIFNLPFMDIGYVNTGISFLYRLFYKINIEAGVNYAHKFEGKSGEILPWAGLCLIF